MTESFNKTQAEIIQGLREIVPASVTMPGETRNDTDLHLDSLAVMDFIMSLEDRFEIVIPLDRVSDVETLADLAKVVDQLRARD